MRTLNYKEREAVFENQFLRRNAMNVITNNNTVLATRMHFGKELPGDLHDCNRGNFSKYGLYRLVTTLFISFFNPSLDLLILSKLHSN